MHATGAGGAQVPVPLQAPAAMLELPSVEQEAAPQVSPEWVWQALPFAAQTALVPQVWSAQVVAQQTLLVPLLTQAPLAHSLAAEHFMPRASGMRHCPEPAKQV